MVHDFLAGFVVLLLFGLKLLLFSFLHLRVSLEYNKVPLLLLLLFVSPFALPLFCLLNISVTLHALVFTGLVLFVLQFLQVTPSVLGFPRDVVADLDHGPELVLDLPEHLYAVRLVLMRDPEDPLKNLYNLVLQLLYLIKSAPGLLLQQNQRRFGIDLCRSLNNCL